MLEAVALTKAYGGRAAVRDFTHRFTDGKITTVLGPSGSGKSTALMMIAGLAEPDSGRVVFQGRDLTRVPAEKRNFGTVFQNYSLFPHLTVLENVEFGLRVRRVPKAQRRARATETLQLARIGHLSERRITQISGGEQQRVAIARALAFRPEVLLMDEPLSALDAKLREELRADLQQLLGALGITTIYVTHDQTEAMSLGHELIILNEGRIEQTGPPADLYQRPANSFVANFLGDSNVFAADPEPGAARLRLPFASVAAPPGSNGAPCWAMIRPEAMRLVEEREADFSATVESTTFLGHRLRLHLRASGERVVIDVENRRVIESNAPVFVKIERDQIATWPR